jgi:hypothetical protein
VIISDPDAHPVSPELLARIRRGASLPRDIVAALLDVLLEQGVLD